MNRRWEVVTFNRGQAAPDVSGVTAVRGDRNVGADTARLARLGEFDAVIDCTAFVPVNTLGIARLLEPVCQRYVLVSTVSIYADWPVRPLTEASPRLDCPPDAGPGYGPDDVEDGPTRYGRLKAGCEVAVEEAFGLGRSAVLRPGVVLGPGEYVGRLPWWLSRIQAGGAVVAPGAPGRFIQPVDVRDVADFALHTIRAEVSGAFNVAAPSGTVTFAQLLEACRDVTGSDARLVWVDDEELVAAGVRQWSELPLWRTHEGVWQLDAARALGSGLTCRPVQHTVHDTWQWMRDAPPTAGHERSAELGLTRAHEQQLLARHRL
ncbi:nucleoside-diphosphate-sugar epimerase [Allocatelliglobosispora scoriae]|uniref:Nucleoside-diphosphate-sugar epimerase n=1 Tax=Allocatelliglobosispora scoriae TaxID=643052 RepID=A0A841C5S6_9ACTN|nr:NAD-dependent epimerase [Allocatelliglobosispora scoriae]MBB5874649.1 nucleoside-diphosphate-sugar epimerase [Allocatelliglobosispora scoriae]